MGIRAKPTIKNGKPTVGRLKLAVPASLMHADECSPCTIENISSAGACVRTDCSVTEDSTVTLCFHLLRIDGVVKWSRNSLCGMRFHSPLEQEDIEGFQWIVENRTKYERLCRDDL